MLKRNAIFAMAAIGALLGGVVVVGAASNLTNTTAPATTPTSCEAAVDDGPDQGADADAAEPGHQDASDAGDAAEPADSCESSEAAEGTETETDGIDHQYEGEEEHTD